MIRPNRFQAGQSRPDERPPMRSVLESPWQAFLCDTSNVLAELPSEGQRR